MKTFSTPLCAIAVITLALTSAFAQNQTTTVNSSASAASNPPDITLSSAAAASTAAADSDQPTLMIRPLGLAGRRSPDPIGIQPSAAGSQAVPPIYSPGFYPADLSNPAHNPAVISTLHHPIFVDKPASHWGDVKTFIKDLGKSEMIEIVDQYVGVSGGERYKLGSAFNTTGYLAGKTTVSTTDIVTLVQAAAIFGGKNFGHVYHVFLPKGIDTCTDKANTVCYSPDNPDTFYFCAYHGSLNFKNGDSILFTVEPYQDVLGCSVPPTGTANNQLIDSTDTVLSHEMFETITDPLGTSWWVQSLTFAYGEEIGDLCTRSTLFTDKHYYWGYGNVKLNKNWYTIQPEYSNVFHGCVYSDFERP